MQNQLPQCARCTIVNNKKLCLHEDGKAPPACPTKNGHGAIARAIEELQKPEIFEFLKQASIQEGEAYGNRERGYGRVKPIKPRIVELIEFAQKMQFQRLGFVFCIGFVKEAQAVEKLLCAEGFEVISTICKVGCVPKESIDIRDDQKININAFESMCNPIAQAFVLNEAQTEFNIVMGLCVGHDSMFLKYAEAPCSVFAVKDRLLGHNPLAAIYTLDSYYRALKKPAQDLSKDKNGGEPK